MQFTRGALHLTTVDNSVVAPGNLVELAAVNGVPAVVDETRALFFTAPGGVPGAAVSISIPSGAGQAVIAPSITGSVVPIATRGHVILVDGSKVREVALNGRTSDQLGGPVPFQSRIYVPDLTKNQVVVLDEEGQQVPGGQIDLSGPSQFTDLSVQNGVLFIDNANSNKAYSVDSEGQLLSINKAAPGVATNVTIPSTIPTAAPAVTPLPTPTPTPTPTPPPTAGVPVGQTVAATAPAAPGNPTATAGNASASLSWVPPDPHGSSIVSYTVVPSPSCAHCAGLAPSSNSTTITGLTNGTSYTFAVSATNGVGTGPSSTSNSVTPSNATPDAPTNVQATAQNGDIKVSWSKANGEGHGISGYTVTPVTASGSTLTPLSAGTGLTAQLGAQQGLIIGSAYTFTVVATNDSGTESAAATSNAATESAAPLAVTGLIAKNTGKGAATVTWQCTASCADGNPVTKFIITTTPAIASSPVTVPATAGTSYTEPLSGLADSTSYTLAVTASNVWGPGQAATAAIVAEGEPTATETSSSPSGLSEVVNFSVNDNGASVSSCSLTAITGGASESGNSCSSITVNVPTYNSAYSGTILINSDYAPGGAAGGTFSFTSGLKVLDADATPDWGTCPSTIPPPANEEYCGANSGSCPGTAFSGCVRSCCLCAGKCVLLDTTGTAINNSYSAASPGGNATVTSAIWVDIPALGSEPLDERLVFQSPGNNGGTARPRPTTCPTVEEPRGAP